MQQDADQLCRPCELEVPASDAACDVKRRDEKVQLQLVQ